MKLTYLAHACFLVTASDGTRILFDPYEAGGFGGAIGYGPVAETADIVLVSHGHNDHGHVKSIKGSLAGQAPHVIQGDGVKTAKGIEFKGVPTYHDASRGAERGRNTVWCFTVDGVRLCHLGDLGHVLEPQQIQEIGKVDVLMVPVGGYFTIDASTAGAVVSDLNPRVVVPMHYKTPKINFPIAPVETFLAGKERVRRAGSADAEFSPETLPEQTEILVLDHAR
jgi:L-ascorbate metabolism protein UlaG (beta-lactamase superfamily)